MSKVDDVIAWAQMELGKPYVFADAGPNAFDCSGLMQFIYAKVGIALPRTAAQQQSWATPVTNPAPGDLVFWGRPATHVALYIGAGKIIEAPHSGANVEISGVGSPTSYGRVPGLGTAVAPVVGLVSAVGSSVSGLLGGARTVLVEALFAVLGLALVGYGAYRAVAPQLKESL